MFSCASRNDVCEVFCSDHFEYRNPGMQSPREYVQKLSRSLPVGPSENTTATFGGELRRFTEYGETGELLH